MSFVKWMSFYIHGFSILGFGYAGWIWWMESVEISQLDLSVGQFLTYFSVTLIIFYYIQFGFLKSQSY